MSKSGRFWPHALQHPGVLPQGPAERQKPDPAIRRDVRLEIEAHESSRSA